MTQSVGLSRGSQKHKQFVQDSANSFVIESFRDVSAAAPGSPADGEGYIVEEVSSIDGSWGTIVGLADNDIIRYRANTLSWEIVHKAVAANQGSKAYIKDEDTLYALDAGAEWAVASGSGGGVKNFAQKQATGYKISDWVVGNNATFGTVGSSLQGALSVETVAPLEGKKSFRYDTAAGSGNDWLYILVDIDQYARGGVIAFTLDYQWDGDEDISVEIWDPTFTTEYSTELNVLKNTENDNKLSRNSRTIYAQPDTESQVVVGFQINSAETAGNVFIWDNLKVTDDIGIISTQPIEDVFVSAFGANGESITANTTDITWNVTSDSTGSWNGNQFTAPSDGVYVINGGVLANGSTILLLGDYINGSFIEWVTDDSANDRGFFAVTRYLKAGDIWSLRCQQSIILTSNVTRGNGHFIDISKVPDASNGLRQLSVPNGQRLKDSFSFKLVMNAGNLEVFSDPYNVIDNIVQTSAVTKTINFNSGIFSNEPTISASIDENTDDHVFCNFNSPTSVASTLITTNGTNRPWSDRNGETFSFTVTKQETSPDIVGVPVSIQGQTHEQDSMIRLTGANGQGTGAQAGVRRFLTIRESIGDAITYVTDATFGDSFTINETGFYCISYSEVNSASNNDSFAITRNTTDLLSVPQTLPVEQVLSIGEAGHQYARYLTTSWSGILNAGDIIRGQNEGTLDNDASVKFTISKIGTQPLIDGGLVETPGSTLFIHTAGSGAAGYGSTNNRIRRFTSIGESSAIANGDVSYTDSATDGMSVEILEDGVYNVSVTHAFDTSGSGIGVSVNSTQLTTGVLDINQGNRVCHDGTSTAGEDICASATRVFRKGDIIRVHAQDASMSVTVRNNRCFFSITKLGQTVKYSSRVYKEDPIAWQNKTLNSNTSSINDLADLTFNNLEIGKTYRVSGLIYSGINNNTNRIEFRDATLGGGSQYYAHYLSGNVNQNLSHAVSFIFVASSTTLITRAANMDGTIFGNGTTYQTNITLEELPFHAQTSKWS